ncbi:DEAD/DEAH box helicase [Amnibacterium sp. CER49]|uniref:DEAD/DEAH box helicase n=1 Tax=Amnibacterium sp. CER49 TaxID=3039161 RepID=UPI002446B043|nr:DEAD/DEAH box helicase [Amnibacterium sp. CER49]MDH2445054.1 DEAD/DEAH box helicase [Amnibacterium sp. CER49]
MARTTATAPRPRAQRKGTFDNTGLIPVLARAVREVETAASRGPVSPSGRTKFQVIAVLAREERARAKSDPDLPEDARAETLKRLDGIATILAKTAARDTSLIALLEPGHTPSDAARALRRRMLEEAGYEVPEDEAPAPVPSVADPFAERQVVPRSVRSRQLANPFLVPDFSLGLTPHLTRRLANWELLGPLFRAFEQGGSVTSMALPEPPARPRWAPPGQTLMHHQAELIESVVEGHRTFLLADEPGLGKTAQSLLAASVANAYPLLAVVPNVVKMNWAREVQRWTPQRTATVIHGDGEDLDAFADVVIVNYEVLDRHSGWLRTLGFKGMVVDEAHFIKNLSSQRSKLVLSLAAALRERQADPLLLALTGTPVINSTEDFKAIWQFLGWIDETKPRPRLMAALEETGLSPADPGFLPAARQAVIDMGVVRRRKIDVAADLPAKRVVDLPVELDDELGRSIKQAERELQQRLVSRYRSLVSARKPTTDEERRGLIRMVAEAELEESRAATTGENIFTMVRKIGQAKAALAADYATQLARSVGKVVLFAKHIDVMDQAEATFARRDIRSISIRGDQSAQQRQREVDAFMTDPKVKAAVCSLTAAGVGLNLQVASNVVLAELSWTAAEQQQAIDRTHRIGQSEPVTAWRIIAAHTIDAKIAELVDSKASLAARALDGDDSEVTGETSVQLDALIGLLTDALH